MISTSKKCVVQVAEDVSGVAGGVPAVVRQLSERMMGQGMSVQVVHATGDSSELPAGLESFSFPPSGLGAVWSWGRGLRTGVANLAARSEKGQSVFHVHGVWSAPQYFAANAAHMAEIPFVVSVHGMLEPWLWNKQGLRVRMKKRAYWKTLGYPALSKASIIHAITPLEREHLTRLFPKNYIEVIPNAIEVDNSHARSTEERAKTILFLGRIEPKKGVDVLLAAFGQAQVGLDWSIDIVGPVWSNAYMAQLKAIIEEFGIGDKVRFHAPTFGVEKIKLLDQAWVMAVPSHSEVVGLVNLEAATRYLPTITTYQTGLHDWESGGGILIEPNVDSLRKALENACSWSAQEQYERGELSRHLVEKRYSWEVILPRWNQLYESLWGK